MKAPRAAVLLLSASAALASFACSTSDTIIALNVTVGSGLGYVSKLHVVIAQSTQVPVTMDYTMLPTTELMDDAGNDAGLVLSSGSLPSMRITLPSSWGSGPATINVTAYDATGALYLTAPTDTVQVTAQAAVAAFVILAFPTPGDGGLEDGGADGGEIDAGVDATATDSASSPDTGAAVEAGSDAADAGAGDARASDAGAG